MHDLSTTVVAVATAPGRGGIGCLRISGPQALDIASTLFRDRPGGGLPDHGRPAYGTFLDERGAAVDRGYAVVFPAARAYTGEPTVELWTHGSPPVLEALVTAALCRGASAAGPGEFTYRALRHGRLDLPRAEAVRDLIAARTRYQAHVAFSQMEGSLSRSLAPLRDELIDLLARGEAAIEFADEAETHLAAGALSSRVAALLERARAFLADARRGRLVREGAKVALSGVTSVGKSSIFNRLLGSDRAIVSAMPGTTRDTLEDAVDILGIPVTLIDTAGLRAVTDPIEAEGVRRAKSAASESDLVVIVLDASRALLGEERGAIATRLASDPAHTLIAANKIDLSGGRVPWPDALPISAATGAGFERLRQAIGHALGGGAIEDDPVFTNARHIAALSAMVLALARADEARVLGDEIVVEELRAAVVALGEIGGELATGDLYDRIFSTFCIGK